MKDSGVEWIGEIPEDWNILRGKTLLEKLERPLRDADETITCFRDGEVTLRSNRREDGFTMADKEIGYQGIEPGDLVVHGMDGFAGAIGISDSRGKGSPVLNVLATDQTEKYLMYYLRSMAYSDVFTAIATGIRVRSCDLRWNKIADLPFPIPPKHIQPKIATCLDKKTATIDHIIEKTKESIEDYKLYKQSLISEAVSRGLNSDVKPKDSGVEWIGKIPEHWGLIGSKRLFEFSSGLAITKASLRGSGEAIISYGQIHSKDNPGTHILKRHIRHVEESITRKTSQVFINDFVFADTSEDYEGVGNFVLNTDIENLHAGYHTIIGRLKTQAYPPYIAYFMLSDIWRNQLRSMVSGVKVFSISQKVLAGAELLLPPLNEQIEISNHLADVFPQIDKVIYAKEQLIEDLEAYKKSLIYEVVTGKREVG